MVRVCGRAVRVYGRVVRVCGRMVRVVVCVCVWKKGQDTVVPVEESIL